jgi:hypothetical protein
MLTRGSEWRRWEPHIHAPGTAMNDQFRGPAAWDDYFAALAAATPAIEAIAVTDYYVTDTYEEVLRRRTAGALPDVKLVFPNVEVRLDVATVRGGWVNLHLFVSPEDPNHLDELRRLLARLRFPAFDDRFDCSRAELIRLGKKADPMITDDGAALTHGASQFKVNFAELKQVFKESAWARANILIAVAGGVTDGTSGVREAADQTLRQEIEAFAHVIFASSEAQREFWLGRKALSEAQIRERYNGLKPCLHGSDAHRLEDVASPFGDRFSWIKGELAFDSLRQAAIDPGGRAYVGAEPPKTATPSQVIAQVEILDAAWAATPIVPLNPGLVAIIGARGSGKTALADVIAAGCDAIPPMVWDEESKLSPSFLARARPLIGDARVRLSWQSGDPTERTLNGPSFADSFTLPRARYLSQQFVEELCSASGMTDGLMREIERVIFDAHPLESRDGALDFAELRDQRAHRYRLARDREAEAVGQISERISTELEKEKLVATYQGQITQKTQLIAGYTTDRARLVPKDNEANVARHSAVAAAAENVTVKMRSLTRQRDSFVSLQDEVGDLRRNQAPEKLRQTQSRYPASGLTEAQWSAFLLDYKGDVDQALKGYVLWADAEVAKLRGAPVPANDGTTPYLAGDADLSALPLTVLQAEMGRIEKLISADLETRRAYAALTTKITQEASALESLKEKLTDSQGARDRARQLLLDRETAYQRAFDAIVAEEAVLKDLYQPLMARLAAASGTLNKLTFTVARVADVEAWATEAEENLVDLRKLGPFRGRGTLVARADEVLRPGWESGTAADVSAAMARFRELYQDELLQHAPVPRDDQAGFRTWSRRFAQWLFSSEHIALNYGIAYDGVDIRKLSPGTRGIVLLLLYLALDDADDRPLIIDQPEENLDPKSVFEELVSLFINAKSKRQVIMVTHNANLVINTDADQIIIAEAGPHPQGGLPPIAYVSGGLETAEIRKAVCDILEGGEHAFQERARRLRVRLDR